MDQNGFQIRSGGCGRGGKRESSVTVTGDPGMGPWVSGEINKGIKMPKGVEWRVGGFVEKASEALPAMEAYGIRSESCSASSQEQYKHGISVVENRNTVPPFPPAGVTAHSLTGREIFFFPTPFPPWYKYLLDVRDWGCPIATELLLQSKLYAIVKITRLAFHVGGRSRLAFHVGCRSRLAFHVGVDLLFMLDVDLDWLFMLDVDLDWLFMLDVDLDWLFMFEILVDPDKYLLDTSNTSKRASPIQILTFINHAPEFEISSLLYGVLFRDKSREALCCYSLSFSTQKKKKPSLRPVYSGAQRCNFCCVTPYKTTLDTCQW
ncbi:hypothetical protein CDAR_257801 [Caerostris darwini]|uniref:Uncharacterized protein n=1 Tax=Caerostris darwini TaxID=1538125 RepID=A0AAV4WYH4_9ARAC|nr:hypothetical protein CDAR_257801 [Caerostris darwini]